MVMMGMQLMGELPFKEVGLLYHYISHKNKLIEDGKLQTLLNYE